MSFIDRLFPQAELEALGNKWHEPAPKRRKLTPETTTQPLPRRQSATGTTRQQHSNIHAAARPSQRSNSDTQLFTSTSITNASNQNKQRTASKSCLPNFIEPSLLKNYLRHLHPKDSNRYADTRYSGPESYNIEDVISSPGSLVADSTSSPESTEDCPTPADVTEQFRSGPFGHIFDGMRVTANERDMMEDLLSPLIPPPSEETTGQKRKQCDTEAETQPEDTFENDEQLLRKIFPDLTELASSSKDKAAGLSSLGLALQTVGQRHDSHENEKIPSHRGIVVYDYDALSVDDFFDLDEAST